MGDTAAAVPLRCRPLLVLVLALVGASAVDECADSCATCGRTTCEAVGQACEDPDHNTRGDWKCLCRYPQRGAATGTPAACEQNDCWQDCDTCGWNICGAAGQVCHDPNPAAAAPGDWHCQCIPPLQGESVAGRPADCSVDECSGGASGDAVCTTAGQSCHDPDRRKLNDWECVCPAPATGRLRGAAATCDVDECAVDGSRICGEAGQRCVDLDPHTIGDWECECVQPASGRRRGGVAACEIDECPRPECTDAGQACRDENKRAAGGWVCTCEPPSRGSRVGGAAVCVLDECTSVGRGVCAGARQRCVDPDTRVLGDWACHCIPPATGAAHVGGLADCVRDECVANEVCGRHQQTCVDPDTSGASLDDWRCDCIPPADGTAVARPARCVLDECTASCPTCAGDTCTRAEQACSDPRKLMSSLNDWQCRCMPPARGTGRTRSVATCVLDECVHTCATCANTTCSSVRQRCHDPRTLQTSLRDWTCSCVPPSAGQAAVGAAATCVFDECKQRCGTCANQACQKAEQDCVDPAPDQMSLNDWECRCYPPAVGAAVKGPAACVVDDCGVGCPDDCGTGICAAVGQRCVDPDHAEGSRGDWVCECSAPSIGVGRQRPAVCILDECSAACATCEGDLCARGGQPCSDPAPFPSSLSDWECRCSPPLTGSATRRLADVCGLDECESLCETCAKTICSDAGQDCVDPDTSPGSLSDWRCECGVATVWCDGGGATAPETNVTEYQAKLREARRARTHLPEEPPPATRRRRVATQYYFDRPVRHNTHVVAAAVKGERLDFAPGPSYLEERCWTALMTALQGPAAFCTPFFGLGAVVFMTIRVLRPRPHG